LLPPGEDETSILGEIPDVARGEPPVGFQGPLVVGRVDVAGEDLWPAHFDEAAFIRRAQARPRRVEAPDADLGIRRAEADASGNRFTPPGVERNRRGG